jgi:hypothetical protein
MGQSMAALAASCVALGIVMASCGTAGVASTGETSGGVWSNFSK